MKRFVSKIPFLAIFIVGIILDYIVKHIVRTNMKIGDTIPLIRGVFHITYTENTGAAFSMLSDKTTLLSVVTVAVVGLLLFLLLSDKIRGKFACVLVALIASGGTGNLIDRIFRGSVTDMFDFRLINFAIFNVADIFVTCGALLFIIVFFVSKGEVLQWNSSQEKKMKEKD